MFTLTTTRNGTMLASPNDQYIGKALIKYGEFSHLEAEFLGQIVKPSMTVVEAGANIGAHTVALSRMVGSAGKVYAIEPQRIIFQALCGNIALNNLTNVFTVNAGASSDETPLLVPCVDYNADNNFGAVPVAKMSSMPPWTFETVPAITLDSLGAKLDRLDVLKIDVEGFEREVLLGGANAIRQFGPIIYCENDRVAKSDALIRTLEEFGYTVYWHHPPLFNPDNFNGVTENDYPGIVSVNMLCLPNGVSITSDHAAQNGLQLVLKAVAA